MSPRGNRRPATLSSDEEVKYFGQGRLVDQEPTEELEAGQLATVRLLLLLISVGPAGEEEALISSVDAT